ncbi:NnrU family protein [Thalassorhabdomicrobium marinisediminis]|uniref:NnrU family protein n=1 Tax=Thalassorhabdomicrobium marinisediminis TaxID=2170577 RepID=UPI00249366B1|nr:NnrU family protein [Thalassorhabdomicrobium marinisediminis]
MIVLLLGLALWVASHTWKRVAPGHRARFGSTGKGIVAALSVVAIVLMVIGYGDADSTPYWSRSPALTGINNLLMLLAFYLFAASGKGTRVTRYIRHPQLTAVLVWSGAHLLVNGDLRSLMLFGGLALWALAEMALINRAEGPRGAYHAPPIKSEIIAVVATFVVFGIVSAIHIWLGYNLFG